MTKWEYARIEYRATATFGTDQYEDWIATFHHAGGTERWGQDEKFDDMRHVNRAGKEGWEVYDRHARLSEHPQRLVHVTYSMMRPGP